MYKLTIAQAHKKLKNKEITALELTKAVLERIKTVEPKVESYLTLVEKDALAQAEAIEFGIGVRL